ncbi:Protein CBG27846 [Caenorhabditis briggsae]|uniref:Uncharacterized protein n=3 Tax=Caenorhabditis briggsae TaxID=6238 RepID=A0AAE8ZSQ1_CAEBR|nr:Protein CBG27846 [Caenorhabditis briggsae]ULT83363.1 hypothetical protein L3Y34_012542 [Caenorhabditis briggsae]CAS00358.1 Protein CBG27846 [Caenorhabditis briggsae]
MDEPKPPTTANHLSHLLSTFVKFEKPYNKSGQKTTRSVKRNVTVSSELNQSDTKRLRKDEKVKNASPPVGSNCQHVIDRDYLSKLIGRIDNCYRPNPSRIVGNKMSAARQTRLPVHTHFDLSVFFDGSYNVEVYKEPYVVVQHDPAYRVVLTELFSDHMHTIIPTDLNYTAMRWNDESLASLLNFVDSPHIHFLFLPFTMRRWTKYIDPAFLDTHGVYLSAIQYDNWFFAVLEKLQNKDLFNLNLTGLTVGVRVHCFSGEAILQANRIKNEICWTMQFQAIRKRLNWKVNNYTKDENCDITLVVTISDKCMMTGIQVRKRQQQIPSSMTIVGIGTMWPFLHAAESLRCVKLKLDEKLLCFCLLTHKEHVVAFHRVFVEHGVEKKNIECWVPMTGLDMETIQKIWDKEIQTELDRETNNVLLHYQKFLQMNIEIQQRISTDLTINSRWVT